jgi:hypothetical protein
MNNGIIDVTRKTGSNVKISAECYAIKCKCMSTCLGMWMRQTILIRSCFFRRQGCLAGIRHGIRLKISVC